MHRNQVGRCLLFLLPNGGSAKALLSEILKKGGKEMFRKLFRTVFTILGCAIGIGLSELIQWLLVKGIIGSGIEFTSVQGILLDAAGLITIGLIFFTYAPFASRQGQKAAANMDSDLSKVPVNDFMAGVLGLIVGLILAYLISQIYQEGIKSPILLIVINLIAYIIFGSAGVMIGSRKGHEVLAAVTALRKPSASKSKNKASGGIPKVLDTSVIIDGRILDIMKTGFLEGDIVIPDFVLVELRHIADSSDSLKRNRGRRGLDILNKIQSDYGIEIYDTRGEKSLEEIPEVDVKLLKLSQIMGGSVVTNDFNLNKVATIQGVKVLNINELANTLKPIVLPGEDMSIFLVKEGKEHGQAVAYLDDGTMIVVEDAHRAIGKTVTVIVTSVLQTAAGRMIFAKLKKDI